MIIAIAAIGPNGELGYENGLIYDSPEDLAIFKAETEGKTIFMGYKTWKSLPVDCLPNRKNTVVLDLDRGVPGDLNSALKKHDNLTLFSEDLFMDFLEKDLFEDLGSDIYIIGGGDLYHKTIEYCDKLLLSIFDESPPFADTFFPEIDLERYALVYSHDYKEFVFYNYVSYSWLYRASTLKIGQ